MTLTEQKSLIERKIKEEENSLDPNPERMWVLRLAKWAFDARDSLDYLYEGAKMQQCLEAMDINRNRAAKFPEPTWGE